MNVDMISNPGAAVQQPLKPAEQIDAARKNKDSLTAEPEVANENPKIQPEELINQIKSVTQEGLYSVRFEQDAESAQLIVKIFDNETQEVIRQIPAEELLNFKATFAELVGNLVDIEG
ncbi:MAG: flagellar biosynthesis protein FlaG [Desulfotalea sp.]|nr:MAG: flagellar biosynthesis protein FlaG [Desulfotalea sp.]